MGLTIPGTKININPIDAVFPTSVGLQDITSGGLGDALNIPTVNVGDMLPSGLGGAFKSPSATNQSLTDAQAAFIMDQLQRNKELWPKMMDQLAANNGDLTKALSALSAQYPDVMNTITSGAQKYQTLADQASQGVSGAAQAAQDFARQFQSGATNIGSDQGAIFDKLSAALAGNQAQLENLDLPPSAKAMLDVIKNSQIQGLQGGADKLVGSAVADLGRRGMMSSSTAEGTFGNISSTLAPYLAQIEAQDAQRRIDLPQQLALQKAGLSKDIFNAGTTGTGIDMNLLNSIFGANMTGANAMRTGAQDVFNTQTAANKNTTGAATDKLNLAGNLFNTQTNANNLMLSPYMSLYGATAGAGSASPAAPTYNQPSPFMQILPSLIKAGGQFAAA